MRFTKVASALAAALLMTLSAQAGAVNIKVWCWDENFNIPAVKRAIDAYQKNNPGTTFTIENFEKGEILEMLHKAAITRDYSKMADIILMEDYSSRNIIINYPGMFKDLTRDIDASKFVDYKTAITTVKDQVYGMPFDTGVSALFVRIDLFEKAGYTLKDFENLTWDKFVTMGIRVKKVTGVSLLPYDPADLQEVRMMMQSAGSWYTAMEDSSKVTIENNEALKESLNIFKRMNNNGLLVTYKGWNDFLPVFQKGRVAAVMSSCWLAPSFMEVEDHKNKWRVVKIPKMANVKATPFSNQGGSQWFINARSRKTAEAIDFLNKTFGSDINLINKLVPEIGLISALKDIYTLPNYQKPNPFFGNQLVGMHFTEWTNYIPPVNYGTNTIEIETAVEEALKKVMAGEDINVVLKNAQASAEAILKDEKARLAKELDPANLPATEILAPEDAKSMDVANYPPPETRSSDAVASGPVYVDMSVEDTAVTQSAHNSTIKGSSTGSTDIADYPPLDTMKSTDVADYPPVTPAADNTDTGDIEDLATASMDDLLKEEGAAPADPLPPAPAPAAAPAPAPAPVTAPVPVPETADPLITEDNIGMDDLEDLNSSSLDEHMNSGDSLDALMNDAGRSSTDAADYPPLDTMKSTDVADYPPVDNMQSTDVADYPPLDTMKSTDVADYPPVDTMKSTDVADYPPVDSMQSTDVADYPPLDTMKSTDVADYPPVNPPPSGAELDDYSDIDLTVDPDLVAQ